MKIKTLKNLFELITENDARPGYIVNFDITKFKSRNTFDLQIWKTEGTIYVYEKLNIDPTHEAIEDAIEVVSKYLVVKEG